jgi:hypothetical protein
MTNTTPKLPKPDCVVKVGGGRGFIIEYRTRLAPLALPGKVNLRKFTKLRLVVTAAHCLPKLPPAHMGAFYWERTYKDLLGNLAGSKNDVWAECLFVDPVADIAILDCPDEQEMDEQAEAYHALIDNAPVLRIGQFQASGSGWVLALDNHWARTPLWLLSGLYGISLSIGPTRPGMSGSPILNTEGRAIGVVTIGTEAVNSKGERSEAEKHGPQAILTRNLPGWLLKCHTVANW